MCGLVGIIAKNDVGFFSKDADIFQQMLYADAIRGWDATGVFGVHRNGNIDIKKQASAAGHFINTNQYDNFKRDIISKYHFVIGHNRKATHGEKKNADAHPFWDKNEKICLVHNGMISNHKEICKTSTVDSAAVANALAETDNLNDVISNLVGAYAFIWYNVEKKRLYFLRNDQRPLYLCETDTTWIVSSEESLAYWIAKRNNTNIKSSAQFAEDIPYYIDLETKTLYKEEKVEQKKSIQVPIYIPTSPKIVTTPQNKTALDIHTIYQSINEVPDTFFLSDSDFKSIDDVPRHIKKGDQILCNVTTYKKIQNSLTYKLTLTLLNTDKNFFNIMMYMKEEKFNILDLTTVLEVSVMSLSLVNNTYHIFVSDPEEKPKTQTSANDVIITESMWFDDRFPMECDVCLEKILWRDLPKCNTWLEDKAVLSIICPKCSGESHSVH